MRLAAEDRERAIRQLDAAGTQGNPLEVIRAAEAYFAAPAPNAGDPRDLRVLALYDRAVVKWFAGHVPTIDDEARARIERYRAPTSALRKGGRS